MKLSELERLFEAIKAHFDSDDDPDIVFSGQCMDCEVDVTFDYVSDATMSVYPDKVIKSPVKIYCLQPGEHTEEGKRK